MEGDVQNHSEGREAVLVLVLVLVLGLWRGLWNAVLVLMLRIGIHTRFLTSGLVSIKILLQSLTDSRSQCTVVAAVLLGCI